MAGKKKSTKRVLDLPPDKVCSDTLKAISEVDGELYEAMKNYPKFASPHEGWAILREEVDELWDEVKLKPALRDKAKMRKEAVQVAAMAIRFMVDLTSV